MGRTSNTKVVDLHGTDSNDEDENGGDNRTGSKAKGAKGMTALRAVQALASGGRQKGSAMRRMSKDLMSINSEIKDELSEEMNERMSLMEERIGSIAKNVDALLVAMENI